MTRRAALVFATAIAFLLVTGITEPAEAAQSAASTWGGSTDPLRASIGVQSVLIEQLSCASAGYRTAFGGFQTAGGPQPPFAVAGDGGRWPPPRALGTGSHDNYPTFPC